MTRGRGNDAVENSPTGSFSPTDAPKPPQHLTTQWETHPRHRFIPETTPAPNDMAGNPPAALFLPQTTPAPNIMVNPPTASFHPRNHPSTQQHGEKPIHRIISSPKPALAPNDMVGNPPAMSFLPRTTPAPNVMAGNPPATSFLP
jgi:hypothetical protein